MKAAELEPEKRQRKETESQCLQIILKMVDF